MREVLGVSEKILLAAEFGESILQRPSAAALKLIFGSLSLETFRVYRTQLLNRRLLQRVADKEKTLIRLSSDGAARVAALKPQSLLPRETWDGKWRLISFDVPVYLKQARFALRRKLQSYGCGMLHKSVWITSRAVLEELEEEVAALKLEDHVWLMEGRLWPDFRLTEPLLRSIWPAIGIVEKMYGKYLSRWRETRRELKNSGLPAGERGRLFRVLRGLAEVEFSRIDRLDPKIPQEFLPKDWEGNKCRRFISLWSSTTASPI